MRPIQHFSTSPLAGQGTEKPTSRPGWRGTRDAAVEGDLRVAKLLHVACGKEEPQAKVPEALGYLIQPILGADVVAEDLGVSQHQSSCQDFVRFEFLGPCLMGPHNARQVPGSADALGRGEVGRLSHKDAACAVYGDDALSLQQGDIGVS